jgi:hypothetical protein
MHMWWSGMKSVGVALAIDIVVSEREFKFRPRQAETVEASRNTALCLSHWRLAASQAPSRNLDNLYKLRLISTSNLHLPFDPCDGGSETTATNFFHEASQ